MIFFGEFFKMHGIAIGEKDTSEPYSTILLEL